jgi:8-oxo-dGTP pyrophosphatase MutT (NUDIX family)
MEFNSTEITIAHPSATVVLVREVDAPLEVLMVRRSRDVKHMGGMWVFPGGRVDAADGDATADAHSAAINAAIRETREETGLEIAADHLFHISHWTTPVGAKKRFATWFFIGVLDEHQEVVVDGGEIAEHRWVTPADALAEQARGDLRLMPPTYITLLELHGYGDCERLRREAPTREPTMFAPRVTQLDEALHFLYEGDAGFDSSDPAAEGARHRCIMVGERLTYLKDH